VDRLDLAVVEGTETRANTGFSPHLGSENVYKID
jgi:hypothetical protein